MQDKARLGRRYVCFSCGCKFYDLNRPEPTCPKCGKDQREDPAPDPRVAVLTRYKNNRPITRDPSEMEMDGDEDVDLDEDEDFGEDDARDDDEEGGEGEADEDW
jgi:Protein of unknown function (FYDLN_acid)